MAAIRESGTATGEQIDEGGAVSLAQFAPDQVEPAPNPSWSPRQERPSEPVERIARGTRGQHPAARSPSFSASMTMMPLGPR